jgi:hypothetical protein
MLITSIECENCILAFTSACTMDIGYYHNFRSHLIHITTTKKKKYFFIKTNRAHHKIMKRSNVIPNIFNTPSQIHSTVALRVRRRRKSLKLCSVVRKLSSRLDVKSLTRTCIDLHRTPIPTTEKPS